MKSWFCFFFTPRHLYWCVIFFLLSPQDPRVFWLVTGFMLLGSGLLWRRLLSFLGRHLEPSIVGLSPNINPPMYLLLLLLPCHLLYHCSHDNYIFFSEIFLFSNQTVCVIPPVCVADTTTVETKSQSIRHEAKSQLMTCHHHVYWPSTTTVVSLTVPTAELETFKLIMCFFDPILFFVLVVSKNIRGVHVYLGFIMILMRLLYVIYRY